MKQISHVFRKKTIVHVVSKMIPFGGGVVVMTIALRFMLYITRDLQIFNLSWDVDEKTATRFKTFNLNSLPNPKN